MRTRRALACILLAGAAGFGSSLIPWEELTEGDWLYSLATRFDVVDGHKVHYPTPTAEMARLLEGRTDPAALRHLAEARLSLGDRKGALEALERWAQGAGPQAWAEAARWEAAHGEPAAALRAAEKALPGLDPGPRAALCDDRVAWAEAHPGLADPIALRKAKADLFPGDPQALEDWLRALEKAGRLQEADQALAQAKALSPERRLLVRSDLKAGHGDAKGAFQVLDEAVGPEWSPEFSRAYALRAAKGAPAAPGAWRATLEKAWDPAALTRLFTLFQGRNQADRATDLLRQAERRYGAAFTRADALLAQRLYASVDAVPEAFRMGLAAAHMGSREEQAGDLARLSRLALKAASRPLAWGTYNDESYRWAAAVDRTPGFWTGGVSFLLTGLDWKEAVDRLESQSLSARTFQVARALCEALAQRAPSHPELPALRVAIMARHVELGEGREALALLPLVENASPGVADQARRQALLAARQTPMPLPQELALMKARLRHRAPDGSHPALDGGSGEETPYWDEGAMDAWTRLGRASKPPSYKSLLDDCVARLDHVDPSHRAGLDLLLTEMDRLPDDEELWMDLAARLEGWNLDGELGPRYQRALQRFQNPGIWDKAARWCARHAYQAELRQLAQDVTERFRGSELFRRAATEVPVQVPDQPPVAMGMRMVYWADLVRLRALERFPHSPLVFQQAQRLVTPAQWQAHYDPAQEAHKPATKVIVPEQLLEERRWAVLFVDAGTREAWFAQAMRKGALEARLEALEARQDRTPVEDLLLFEGWGRLSRFERAVAPGERLCRAYPGDEARAHALLSLHRSLNALESSHAAPARELVERTAPALENPNPLWTELGEMEEDRGQGAQAIRIWGNLLARSPGDPEKIGELATLLWDYNHDKEALEVVEAGRKALGRPRFFAFETGVLREDLRDLDGAVREYLAALEPEDGTAFTTFENDQRALRRLAQLLARERVFSMLEARIRALVPGRAEDEKQLAALWPLGTIETPDPGLLWDADAWIDAMDMPNDPAGRAEREARKDRQRPAQFEGIRRIGDLELSKLKEMVPQATSPGFLAFAEGAPAGLGQERWNKAQAVAFRDAVLARRAQLATDPDERVRLDMDRAQYLADNGRVQDADAVWASLAPRIDALPEGSARLKAEAARAGYLERAKGIPAAAQQWRTVTARYPWSLALLQDRLAFLDRAGLGEEGRALLQATVPRAASGHRENLLEQLTRASLSASDLKRARWAADQLLAQEGLEDARRLAASHLLARLSFREDPAWDPFPFAKAQAALVKPEAQADLYRELARAADQERNPRGAALWIEALNRRTERAWLAEAARGAERAGTGGELQAFFDKQHERSPRDVRWAVAVRDLRTFRHDVDGAIAAAKEAVAVRPEQEALWREATDLLVRADRAREAADFLEGWNRLRPASEDVAQWRSGLYARAGDADRALAVEQAALKAYDRGESAEPEEKALRRSRAALRLFSLGLPDRAARLFSASGSVAAVPVDPVISEDERAQMALLTGQFPRLLGAGRPTRDALAALGASFARHARPEQREEIQDWLLKAAWPQGAPQPDSAALDRWWPFIAAANLEQPFRAALARRLLAARPGPWQADAPFPFMTRVGSDLVVHTQAPHGRGAAWAFREPELPRLWAWDLARRDRAEDLLAFTSGNWADLVAQVKGQGPLDRPLPWTAWLRDPMVLSAWARAASAHPERVEELGGIMGERRLWDRFWAAGARSWSTGPLLAILPVARRTAWFRFWDKDVADPVLLARRDTVEHVAVAMARLVQGVPGAADDALVARLRGPMTVGEVLGADARWTWPEFQPRLDARGAIAETGDDRVYGQGVDRGRVPGALWGDRPGEAWYVLEALVRYRKGDPTAPLLPLDTPQKGGETSRVLLALRMARARGDLALAREIAEARPGPAKDRAWLEGSLALLVAADRRAEAQEAFQAYVRRVQGELTETSFNDLAVLSARFGLASPLACLDPGRPVGPVFLAYLVDRRPEEAKALRTADAVNYRTALQNRWWPRMGRLDKAQAGIWMRDLWASGSAPLPREVLARIGPVWAAATEWLNAVPGPERKAAIASLEEALDPARPDPALLAELEKGPWQESRRFLAARIRLARGEADRAFALADAMAAQAVQGGELTYPYTPPEPAEKDEAGNEAAEAPDPQAFDPLATRLEAWLAPFRAAGKAQRVEERFRKVLAEKRQEGAVNAKVWSLSFRLAPASEAPALAQELEEAWFRGEVWPSQFPYFIPDAAQALGPRLDLWLARWQDTHDFEGARLRAAVLERVKRKADAVRLLVAARAREPWTAQDEARAFEIWRRLAPEGVKVPDYWTGSRAVWTGAASLQDRLRAHPCDLHAARAALASASPGSEDALAQAAQVLATSRTWARDPGGDALLLRLRGARGLLPRSARAASLALGEADPEAVDHLLAARHFKAADIQAALADLARIASRTDQESRRRACLALLAARNAPGLKALEAELAPPPGKAEAFRMENGRPVPIRPRDLTWTMLSAVLDKEGVR